MLKMRFWINSIRRAIKSLSESSVCHIVTLMTLFLPQNLPQLPESYLNLLFTRDNNNITTKLHDKLDTFGFQNVNFPFMSSNIPSASAYHVYACSQLIHYAYCCSNYSDFLSCHWHRALVTRLLYNFCWNKATEAKFQLIIHY